jgi:putative Holliday junction resolvase
MAIVALADLPGSQALFGLDLGEKTIGIAVSDTSGAIATPLTTLARTKFTADAAKLFALMAERGAVALVIGLPLNMDGSEGVRCQSTRAFASNLLRLKAIPIAFWDERLSTAAVHRSLIEEGDVSRSRRARIVDRAAAAWILQGALDRLRVMKARPTTAL